MLLHAAPSPSARRPTSPAPTTPSSWARGPRGEWPPTSSPRPGSRCCCSRRARSSTSRPSSSPWSGPTTTRGAGRCPTTGTGSPSTSTTSASRPTRTDSPYSKVHSYVQTWSGTDYSKNIVVDEKDHPYTGTKYAWVRARCLGGKTNIWGRLALRLSDYDFKAKSHDGYGEDWPIVLRRPAAVLRQGGPLSRHLRPRRGPGPPAGQPLSADDPPERGGGPAARVARRRAAACSPPTGRGSPPTG